VDLSCIQASIIATFHSQFKGDSIDIPEYQRLILIDVNEEYRNMNKVDIRKEYKVLFSNFVDQ